MLFEPTKNILLALAIWTSKYVEKKHLNNRLGKNLRVKFYSAQNDEFRVLQNLL